MVPFIVCIERHVSRYFITHMETRQLIYWLNCLLSKTLASGKHALKRTFLKIFGGCFCIATFWCLCIYCKIKPLKQKVNHKCAMIHSQDVHISDKNCNLLSSVNRLSFNFDFKFFTVSAIKSLSPSWCYTC